MKYTFLAISLLFISIPAFSQEPVRCKTVGNPLTEQQEKLIFQYKKDLNLKPGPQFRQEDQIIKIPVVFHIIYNKPEEYFTYDQVVKQLEVLNKDFRRLNSDTVNTPGPFKPIAEDAEIEFVLAKQDPDGNPTDGITYRKTNVVSFENDNAPKEFNQGGTNAWDTRNYLNIWVCNFSDALGFTIFDVGSPYSGVLASTKTFSTYGPSLSTKFNLGRTVTHEVGHWFGLIHIWGDVSCGNDQVDDTPVQHSSTSDNLKCPPFPYRTNDDNTYCVPNLYGRNFSNYLDYSQDACMNMFTKGQVNRMRATILTSRKEILLSPGLFPPFNNDLALVQIPNDTAVFCNSIYDAAFKVRIKNNGSKAVNGYRISVQTGTVQKDYDWQDTLPAGADKILDINFGERLDKDTNKLEISCQMLAEVDEYTFNNSKTLTYKCTFPLIIYPNPVSETLHLKGNIPKAKRARLYSLEGKEMLSTEFPMEINVSSLLKGYYTLVIETDKGTERHKIIVSHD